MVERVRTMIVVEVGVLEQRDLKLLECSERKSVELLRFEECSISQTFLRKSLTHSITAR